MPGHFDRKVGEVVGDWTLLGQLGSGGNAEVWRARGKDGEEIALKILRQRKPSSEPYRRFQDEIEILRRLGLRPGVLPLVAHSLPETPTREAPAWVATPVAIPIRQALGEESFLRDVVVAVRAIAATLAALAVEHGVYHRDVKPENLYSLDGSWCIGDFGLVTFPGKDSITASGRHIGPLYYLAPELLGGGIIAPGPADVFAIAKTLWVLATGQTYPLPGHLSSDVPQFQLKSFTTGEGTRWLDLLIARATLPDPRARPTMSEIADELTAWLVPRTNEPTTLLSASTIDHVAPLFEAHLRAAAEPDRKKNYVLKRLEEITIALRRLGAAIAHVTTVQPEYGPWVMFRDAPEVKSRLLHDGVSFQMHAAFHVTMPAVPGASSGAALVSGINMAITDDGLVHVFGAHVVHRGLPGTSTATVILTDTSTAPMDSARERVIVDDAVASLARTLDRAIETFVKNLS